MAQRCEHFADLREVEPQGDVCAECVALGSKWTELRVCLTCGHVGCCEDSKHAHALQHFKSTGHPIIAPLEAEKPWTWCYVDRRYFDPMPQAAGSKKRSGLAGFLGRLVGR